MLRTISAYRAIVSPGANVEFNERQRIPKLCHSMSLRVQNLAWVVMSIAAVLKQRSVCIKGVPRLLGPFPSLN